MLQIFLRINNKFCPQKLIKLKMPVEFMISEEQAEKIREALMNQIETMQLSPEEKGTAKSQIMEMSPERLEEFVKPNCIFCNIARGQADSYKVMENQVAVIVLEINPMSKGHSILIPKEHIMLADFPEPAFSLLHKFIKRLNQVLKPKQINITSSETEAHTIINIMPLFGDETGKRTKAEPSELGELQRKLIGEESIQKILEKKPEKKEKPSKPEISEPEIVIEKIPSRIP